MCIKKGTMPNKQKDKFVEQTQSLKAPTVSVQLELSFSRDIATNHDCVNQHTWYMQHPLQFRIEGPIITKHKLLRKAPT